MLHMLTILQLIKEQTILYCTVPIISKKVFQLLISTIQRKNRDFHKRNKIQLKL